MFSCVYLIFQPITTNLRYNDAMLYIASLTTGVLYHWVMSADSCQLDERKVKM